MDKQIGASTTQAAAADLSWRSAQVRGNTSNRRGRMNAKKTCARALTSSALAVAISLLWASGAEAKWLKCTYIAHNWAGYPMAVGTGSALKKSWACNRARRRCNRQLEWKRRRGQAGRGSCGRIESEAPPVAGPRLPYRDPPT